MKRLLCIAALALTTGPALAQVSIGINQPGLFGRIELGGFPPPQLLNAQPVYIERQRGREAPPPVYLHVPPVEQQNWGRYCSRYAACEQPVYFVREDWVRERYIHEHPDWERRHGRDWHDGRGHDRGDDRRHDRHD